MGNSEIKFVVLITTTNEDLNPSVRTTTLVGVLDFLVFTATDENSSAAPVAVIPEKKGKSENFGLGNLKEFVKDKTNSFFASVVF